MYIFLAFRIFIIPFCSVKYIKIKQRKNYNFAHSHIEFDLFADFEVTSLVNLHSGQNVQFSDWIQNSEENIKGLKGNIFQFNKSMNGFYNIHTYIKWNVFMRTLNLEPANLIISFCYLCCFCLYCFNLKRECNYLYFIYY